MKKKIGRSTSSPGCQGELSPTEPSRCCRCVLRGWKRFCVPVDRPGLISCSSKQKHWILVRFRALEAAKKLRQVLGAALQSRTVPDPQTRKQTQLDR